MHNVWIVFKKEMARFFKDTRLFFSTVIFPGLLLFIVYNVVGVSMQALMKNDTSYTAQVVAINYPDSIKNIVEDEQSGIKAEVTLITEDEVPLYQARIRDQEIDLLMIFESDFDQKVVAASEGGAAPSVQLYYNSTRTESSYIYSQIKAIIDQIETSLTHNVINLNDPGTQQNPNIYDQATEQDLAGFIFSSIFPFLILVFISSGVVGLTAESIAGEKERGTLATVLVTPIKRGEYAIGKILALAVEALLSGVSSFLGVLFSFPQLAGIEGGFDLILSSFGVGEFLSILLIIATLVILVVAAMAIVSAFARTVKEAGGYSAPIMMLFMVLGITSMISGGGASTNFWIYLLPIVGPLQALVGIFSFSGGFVFTLIAAGSTLVYAAGLSFILVKMFNNERIIFKQ